MQYRSKDFNRLVGFKHEIKTRNVLHIKQPISFTLPGIKGHKSVVFTKVGVMTAVLYCVTTWIVVGGTCGLALLA
jgi:hypothetical protein